MANSGSLIASRIMRSCLVLVALVGLACRGNEPQWGISRGTIEFLGDSAVDIPQQMTAGQAALVTIYTFGDVDCYRPAWTRLAVTGATAVIEPFDWVVVGPANTPCDRVLRQMPHSVSLTFSQAGPAAIRIVGWRDAIGVTDTLEYSVTVQ